MATAPIVDVYPDDDPDFAESVALAIDRSDVGAVDLALADLRSRYPNAGLERKAIAGSPYGQDERVAWVAWIDETHRPPGHDQSSRFAPPATHEQEGR